jgi:hypothetical protein
MSLCSKNCKMMLRRYSRLTSSSFSFNDAVSLLGEFGDEGRSVDDIEALGTSVELPDRVALQYPTPGARCRSNSAAEDCTLRSSSRKVWQ